MRGQARPSLSLGKIITTAGTGRWGNLWKYNLSRSWRLVYTIARDGDIVVVVLEWFSHEEYERRFG